MVIEWFFKIKNQGLSEVNNLMVFLINLLLVVLSLIMGNQIMIEIMDIKIQVSL